jgi:hypothetical protein
MAAQVIPMVRVSEDACQSDWREHYLEFLNTRLDRMEEGCRMDSLGDRPHTLIFKMMLSGSAVQPHHRHPAFHQRT